LRANIKFFLQLGTSVMMTLQMPWVIGEQIISYSKMYV